MDHSLGVSAVVQFRGWFAVCGRQSHSSLCQSCPPWRYSCYCSVRREGLPIIFQVGYCRSCHLSLYTMAQNIGIVEGHWEADLADGLRATILVVDQGFHGPSVAPALPALEAWMDEHAWSVFRSIGETFFLHYMQTRDRQTWESKSGLLGKFDAFWLGSCCTWGRRPRRSFTPYITRWFYSPSDDLPISCAAITYLWKSSVMVLSVSFDIPESCWYPGGGLGSLDIGLSIINIIAKDVRMIRLTGLEISRENP